MSYPYEILQKLVDMPLSARALLCTMSEKPDHLPGLRIIETTKYDGIAPSTPDDTASIIRVKTRCLCCGDLIVSDYSDWWDVYRDAHRRSLLEQLESQILATARSDSKRSFIADVRS